MNTRVNRSYWIATGLERLPPSLRFHRPGEALHRVALAVLAVAWSWMIVAALFSVAELFSIAMSSWSGIQLAMLTFIPGTLGIALSMFLEALARRRRRH